MTERIISTVLNCKYVGKVGKYVVKLAFPDEKAKEYWMSEKQLDRLLALFNRTPKGHSTGKIQIIGSFDDRGYYAYARHYIPPWEPPPDYDLEDLRDDD